MSLENANPPLVSPFPPIADYGFLSDCETCALVAPSGAIEWMCLPRYDGPSVFGAILDRDAGTFRLGPADTMVPAARRYLPGTMILETSWGTSRGWIIVRDVLLIGPWHDTDERSSTHRRAPTDHDADHVLLRTVRCVNGSVEIQLECDPIFDYGRRYAHWEYAGSGYREAYDRLVKTADYWHQWLAHGTFPDHPWRQYLQRSALTLKGLTYSPTGAICAAGSTSLPETPGGERNYDYRFTWIRDATFALWGLYSLGFDWEAVDFFSFIADIATRDEHLQIMYGIGAERELEEFELDHLPGYAGSRPVRIGNAAYSQNQHDVWGALLDSVYLHFKAADHVDGRIWPILDKQVNEALKYWREPDAGIWEVRGQLQHFTSSKIMCWVAVDRGAKIARISGEEGKANE